ncbi:MAG: protein-L-isoaspartate O-methyltransferase [Alphaproteobacteria bacterium]|nr:protein-L-isoaspartate O-methyltransferase [Alphaproteobacteria bacterium]
MDAALLDYEDARNRMVDSQIRPNKVVDPRILRAMRQLPRERFVPAQARVLAYADEDVPLGNGRALMEPMVLARVVGAGPGYGAAVLAACGANVTALEEDEGLLGLARQVLPTVAPAVTLVEGKLASGWPQGAPWDIILIEGAVRDIPAALGPQLHPESGRLLAVCTGRGSSGKAVLAEPTPVGLRAQPVFDCATPLIPSLLPEPGFVF